MLPLVGHLARGAANLFGRRPAVPMALALITGIISEPLLPAWPLAWLVCLAGLIVAAVVTLHRQSSCSLLLLAALFLAGLSAAQLDSFYFSSRHIARFTAEEPKLAQLELRVISPPRIQSIIQGARPLPTKQARAALPRGSSEIEWHRPMPRTRKLGPTLLRSRRASLSTVFVRAFHRALARLALQACSCRHPWVLPWRGCVA